LPQSFVAGIRQITDPDRRFRTPHLPRYLLVRPLFDDAKQNRRGLLFGQAGDGFEDGGPKASVFQPLRDRRGRTVGPLIRQARDFVAKPAPASPDGVVGRGDRDPEHEGFGIRMPGHRVALLPDPGQGILESVLGRFPLSNDAPDRADHPGLHGPDQSVIIEVPVLHRGRFDRAAGCLFGSG